MLAVEPDIGIRNIEEFARWIADNGTLVSCYPKAVTAHKLDTSECFHSRKHALGFNSDKSRLVTENWAQLHHGCSTGEGEFQSHYIA
jgi:hypothetical protein